ncbi:flagellar motor protein MotB [Pontibacter korlensis]|uniref:Flagellar motor protein MotB n=2 Tax=Pontibacter korlensis TaxID=400092 RepID=A0A0E3ZHH1_9BACT|nr:flagellar motor protein MotB [Pontibacter korlensis]
MAASGFMTVLAQDMKQADKYFNNFEFSLALEAYKKVLEKEEPSLLVVQRIADSYRILNNSKEAEFWYAQVIAFPNSDPANIYLYAESAKRNANYDKAKQLFLEYSEKVPAQREVALRMAASCDTAKKWMKNPKPYVVEKMEVVNSDGADFGPVRTKDGLLFSSDRLEVGNKQQTARNNWTGNGFIQMYFAQKLSDTTTTLANPVPLPPSINTEYHNGPADYLEKDQTLYFTRTHVVKKRATGSVNSDPTSWFKGSDNGTHTNRHGIYMSKFNGSKWENVEAFKYNNTDEFSIGHPAISPDGKILYFVSDMPGGYGETDIYYSERMADGSWGKPTNAGPVINTSGRESFANLGEDGKLYFSSDGHMGMGGLDLFRANGTHKAWTQVENLQYPLNTSQDDFGIEVDSTGKKGLLSSSRLSDNGFDDILTFEEYKGPCLLVGRVVEKFAQSGTVKTIITSVPDAMLQLYVDGSEEAIETKSDAEGNFSFPVMAGTKYQIKGSKKGYLSQTVAFTPECLNDADTVEVELTFIRSTPNKPVVIENIYYDLDKFDIKPAAALELDRLVQMMKDNPRIRIELSSHTDSRQTHKYNQVLSQLRAQSAVDYLVSKGVDRNRLVARGYGETRLINKCRDGISCAEELHQENRRTEFKILR